MSNQIKGSKSTPDLSVSTRCIWVTLEAPEVIELKRIEMDHDTDAAVSFFWEVINPRVRTAAMQRRVAVDSL